jgi:AAA+ ATPase superfamily predicted ATPase
MLTLDPLDRTTSRGFLAAGFREGGLDVPSGQIDEVLDAFGGIPGWLTFYGNCRIVTRLDHLEAMNATEHEAFKTSRQSIEHYLEDRSRHEHGIALKAIAAGATWSEVRRAIEARTGKPFNDGSLKVIIDSLLAGQLVEKRHSSYVLTDPVMRRFVLSGSFKVPG